uniref:Uncharacterized protein n=1 Tax=Panagrolaimus sp. ES5 TaxID=591445 RepID=A0AC34FA80_9BILA
MKSFRNLFRSKKDEKDKECTTNICAQRTEQISATRLPPAIKQATTYQKPRQFLDDMNLFNPSAAYHGEIRPATRRPLRSCPGDVNLNPRNCATLSDSDDDEDFPFKHEKRRFKAPKSHYGGGGERKAYTTTRTKFEAKETSEYGSEDHSPISNALKFAYENDSYFQKYRKYKKQAIYFYDQTKKLQSRIHELEYQLKESNQRKVNLNQQVENLKKQLQNSQNYNYPHHHQYHPTYYHHHQQQQFAPPPLSSFPPLPPPPPISFSTAPTISMENDDIKNFRHLDTDSKPLSPASFSSTSFTNFGNFKPDKKNDRNNSHSFFGDQENLIPKHSFNDNF